MAATMTYTKVEVANTEEIGRVFEIRANDRVVGFMVESDSNPFGYQVNVAGQCSCPGYGYRGTCKHVVTMARRGIEFPAAE